MKLLKTCILTEPRTLNPILLSGYSTLIYAAGLLWLAGCASPPAVPPAAAPDAVAEEFVAPPRVLVMLTEKNSAGQPVTDVESVILRRLMERDVPVVDHDTVRRNRDKIGALLAQAGDDHGAAAVAMQFGADVIIRGEAEARQTATGIRGSNLNGFQATVTMRAIYADDGGILATASAAAPAIALDEVSGSAKAMQAAGAQAADKMIADLARAWRAASERAAAGGGMSLSAVFKPAPDADADVELPRTPRGHKPCVAAVWQLAPQVGVQPEWMAPLTETLYAVLSQSGWFRLVTREDMEKIMAEHNIQLSDICDTTERAVEFGKIMSAQKMVIGNVSKLGSTYQVVLKLINVETGEIEKVGRSESRGTMDILFKLVRQAAADLLRQAQN